MVFMGMSAHHILQMPIRLTLHYGVFEVRIVCIAAVDKHILSVAAYQSRISLSNIDEMNTETTVFRECGNL